MDASCLDDQSLLADTPTGRLCVIMFAGAPWVARRHPHDPDRPPQLIQEVTPEQGVLDAIYGKAFWEQSAHRKAYERFQDAKAESAARTTEAHRRDFRRELRKYLWRHEEAADRLRGLR